MSVTTRFHLEEVSFRTRTVCSHNLIVSLDTKDTRQTRFTLNLPVSMCRDQGIRVVFLVIRTLLSLNDVHKTTTFRERCLL